ncbi:hypothetical protein [Mycolicibacter acidiphilus]
MPTRRRTREQDRSHRITAERRRNREARLATPPVPQPTPISPPAPPHDDEPPPF